MRMTPAWCLLGTALLLGQGCVTPGPADRQSTRIPGASLADLGNGTCLQANGLLWQVDSSEILTSGEEARTYAENLVLGGHNDWRLPTKDEYYSLCNIFELRQQGDCPIKLKGNYWLSDDPTSAGQWESYPLCGGSEFRYLKGKKGRVRAVRP